MQNPAATIATAALVVATISIPISPCLRASAQANQPSERMKVYFSGKDVTPPELLPPQPLAPMPKCHQKLEGTTKLSLIVDANGHPRNVFFEQAIGSDLDKLALSVVESDRFKPASVGEESVAVARMVEVHTQACVEKEAVEGKKVLVLKLRSQPEQKFADAPKPSEAPPFVSIPNRQGGLKPEKVEGGVTPPRLIASREAEFSDEARRAKIDGNCFVTLTVDVHGLPQDVHVVRSLEKSLDRKAVEAVLGYRFRPAMKDGGPLAVLLNVEISFHLY